MFFHKTSEKQYKGEREYVRKREKGRRKSYFQNDSQEANANPNT